MRTNAVSVPLSASVSFSASISLSVVTVDVSENVTTRLSATRKESTILTNKTDLLSESATLHAIVASKLFRLVYVGTAVQPVEKIRMLAKNLKLKKN